MTAADNAGIIDGRTRADEEDTLGDAGTATATATELIIPEEERNLRGLELAERHFPVERRAQIAAFLEIPPEDPALLPYLAWCASNDFSPIAGHVWLIPRKIKGKDGEADRTIYKPAVGRDGLLHRARGTRGQPGGYKGMKFGVVCSRDTFEMEDGTHLEVPRILHRMASKPVEFGEDEAPDRYRGVIMGAWAICYVEGEPPTAYYANLREHGRLRQVWQWHPEKRKREPLYVDDKGKVTWDEFGRDAIKNKPKQEWDGAWDYLSTMILKAAQSYVLRIALGITGVVPVDELRDPRTWSEPEEPDFGATYVKPLDDIDLNEMLPDVDAELRERLQRAVDAANEQQPFSWGAAKCEMVFTDRSEDELREKAELIERENELREKRVSIRQEPETEEEPVDAEVVKDDENPRTAALRTQLEIAERDLGAAEEGSEEQAVLRAEVDRLQAEIRGQSGEPL